MPRKQERTQHLEDRFRLVWAELKGPPLVYEHTFAPPRKWRFDFACPRSRVAVEIEGGVWSGGRHVRPKGFIADCEKYNTAAAQGWTVYRLPEAMLTTNDVYPIVEDIRNKLGMTANLREILK